MQMAVLRYRDDPKIFEELSLGELSKPCAVCVSLVFNKDPSLEGLYNSKKRGPIGPKYVNELFSYILVFVDIG